MFLTTAAAAAGTITVLPYMARAAGHAGDSFHDGAITVHPVSHASFVMETPAGVIYVDPVGDVAQYEGFAAPDLILVTHEHGDHYNLQTLKTLMADKTALITNPAVNGMLPEDVASAVEVLGNGDSTSWNGIGIDAIPAYNYTEGRTNFHPQGRDNGYVLSSDGFRVYISGDTEDIPEMRALTGIDLAFVCMNLPFTMTAEAAADAVKAFKPAYVYPYHYRGRDNGTQDPQEFAELVGGASDVKFGGWYGKMPS
jgi:L-ascorbate metabolism protein UlaG (beta-lactamase superfamily)